MTNKSTDWRDYEHIVKWVEEVQQWAQDFQVHEWIASDEQGLDPSKRVPGSRVDELGEIEENLIWTLWDTFQGRDSRYITSEFESGNPQIFGWYIARVPYSGNEVIHNAGMYACNTCEGEGIWFDADFEEIHCEECEGGETSEWIDLQETSFQVVS